MLDIVVRRFHLRLRPSKVDGRGPEGGREGCGRRIRECLGAISINGVAEVHFGVCKWQINPGREEGREGEAPLKRHCVFMRVLLLFLLAFKVSIVGLNLNLL